MQLRVCSILGTLLLALSVASPAFAEGDKGGAASESSSVKRSRKKAKKAPSELSDAEKVDLADKLLTESKADDFASSAKKSKRKSKRAREREKAEAEKKAEEEKAAAAAAAEASAAEEPVPEPAAWEAPPQEQEKPPAPPAAPPKAETAGDGKPWSVGLLLGWGFETDRRSTVLAADAYGLGFGARGGYTLDIQLYVGVFVMYYLGGSQTGDSQGQNDFTTTTNASYLHGAVEIGYDWWIGPLIVRPSIMVGAAIGFTDSSSAANQSGTLTEALLAPGLTLVHPWDEFFLGGEGRANIVTGDGVSSVLVAATGGMRF